MKHLILISLLALTSCAVSKTKLSDDGERVKVLNTKPKKGCNAVKKVVGENDEGVEVASGYAHEKQNSSFINKTSFIENCETSAWGRCLGNFGIGVDESVASADEVANAINNQ